MGLDHFGLHLLRFQQHFQRLADRGAGERAGDVRRGAQACAAVQLQCRIGAQVRADAAHAAIGLRVLHVFQ
ncbi:hypothetical protein G6F52_014213 [Rhizopus delemar]|nr:hypothetical protein G6F52_014213 [Rhizopus delemar]